MATIYNTPLSTASEKALFGRPGGGKPDHKQKPPKIQRSRAEHYGTALKLKTGLTTA